MPALIVLVGAWSHRWVGDDGFINLRIVRQIQAGHGPVYNIGERVEAGTSPLWLALLVVADAVMPLRLEWIAVVLGIGCTLLGVATMAAAAIRIAHRVHPSVVVPAGVIAIGVLAAFWDYASSGLESGLQFGWLGCSLLALTMLCERARTRQESVRSSRVAALVGLGPLIRPDLAVFSIGFVVVLLGLSPWSLRRTTRLIVAAAALPAAYQVFRMGFFAALVPNTALAKSAGSLRLGQGLRYLSDAASTYYLWLALPALVIAMLIQVAIPLWRQGDPLRRLLLVVAVTAALHAIYVVLVGGDFMHARLLLPGLFVLLGVVALPLPGRRSPRWMLWWAAFAVWAVCCGVFIRSQARDFAGIVDERWYYSNLAADPHPVTLDDYRFGPGLSGALVPAELAAQASLPDGATGLLDRQVFHPATPAVPYRPGVYRVQGWIGITGYAVGIDTFVLDALGLADPLVSRLEVPFRTRPGHEKLSVGWAFLRVFPEVDVQATVGAPDGSEVPFDRAQVLRIVACPAVARLLHDVTAPMSAGRFFGNVVDSFANTRLRLPYTPTGTTGCP